MRVLILNQFFHPDTSATSQLMTDLADDLGQHGVQVTALSSRTSYLGGPVLAAEAEHNGTRIVRVFSFAFDRGSTWKRLLAYLSFHLAAFVRLFRLPRHDAVIVLTTPPLIVMVAIAYRLFSRWRVIYLVQDLYPDIAVRLGVLRAGGLLTRLLERVSRFALTRADAVVVLGECMRKRVEGKRVSPEKLFVIQNWADGGLLGDVAKEQNPFLAEHRLAGKFVVLYSGNMGRVHDLETILEAAIALSRVPDVLFLFIGDGPKKDAVQQFAESHSLRNIRLLPYCARDQLRHSLSAGDVHLVSLCDGLEGLVVPSKLYGIMAAGRPVLYVGNLDSEAAQTVRDAACGFVVRNGDARSLQDAILNLRQNRQLVLEQGRRARAAFESRFERRILTRRYFELLQRVCQSGSADSGRGRRV